MKKCKLCKIEKPVTEFYSANKYKDRVYLSSNCKSCDKSKQMTNSMIKHQLDPQKYLFETAKNRAKKKSIPFTIEVSDIEIPEYCPILGLKLGVRLKGIQDNSMSLDRIVPELGYIKGNIRVISYRANAMKSNASMETLIMFANWILSQNSPSNF